MNTLARMMKYGPTVGRKACAFGSERSVRSPPCRARFNALVRADRVASGARAPGVTVAPPTPLFMGEDLQLPHGEASADVLSRTVEEHTTGPEIEPENFSGTKPIPKHEQGISSLQGRGTMFEYACSENSVVGEQSSNIGVKCICLNRGV